VQTIISILWLLCRAYALVNVVTRVLTLVRDPASIALLIAEDRTILDGAAYFSGTTTPILSCLCSEDDARVHRLVTSSYSLLVAAVDAARCSVAEDLRGVGALVFDDGLNALMRRHEEDGGASTTVLPGELAIS
jgi:hypothetical protein